MQKPLWLGQIFELSVSKESGGISKMRKQILKNKFWVILFLCLVFITPTGNVFAQHHGGGGRGGHHGDWNWGYHHPSGYHWYGGSW